MGGHRHHRWFGERTTLDQLHPCEGATIEALGGDEELRARLRDLGFREGTSVVMIKQAPLADPLEFRVLGAHVTLRRSEARRIEITGIHAVEEPGRRWVGFGRRHRGRHRGGFGWLQRLRGGRRGWGRGR